MITHLWRREQHSPFLTNAITMEKVASLSCYEKFGSKIGSIIYTLACRDFTSFRRLGVGNSPAHSLASAAEQPISCFRTKKDEKRKLCSREVMHCVAVGEYVLLM